MGSFTTKARTVELLGRKQIRDAVTAIAELMKNSYDADAPLLRVEFNTQTSEPRVIVADSGKGMSKTDIESKWLVLGTSSKTHRRVRKTDSGRPLMGAKGIGRLASATVGRQLWMFTKTEKSLWNIVYIHWGLFENPNIAIHEVNVPTRFDVSGNELLLRFDSIRREMMDELLANLESTAWNAATDNELDFILSLKAQILKDIESTSIAKNHISKFVQSFSNGTILFIEKLYDNWDNYLRPMSSEERKNDPMTEKMSNRFSSFVSTLRYADSPKLPFEVEVFYNNKVWDEDLSFSEEDYNIYDIKVEGRITKGKFYGTLDACNADKDLLARCNAQLQNGLDVTPGISDWESKDCGSFSIKFCHIEGELKRSGLSPDDYSRIKNKLNVSCGISVYRDGIRILPYGEPENDFISIEARRTEKASRYIFSHRNIFGRIDINSVDNPFLEDKSSREGLIENAYYHYFVKVLENLLVILAVDYLSSERKDSFGIQKSFVDKNKAHAEDERIRSEFEKKENQFAKNLVASAPKWLNSSSNLIVQGRLLVESFYQQTNTQISTLSVEHGYNQLSKQLDLIRMSAQRIREELGMLPAQCMEIPSHMRKHFGEDLLSDIEEMNLQLLTEFSKLQSSLDEYKKEFSTRVQNILNCWVSDISALTLSNPDAIRNSLDMRLSSLVDEHRKLLNQIMEQSQKNRDHILAELKPVEDYITQLHSTYELEISNELAQVNQGIAMLADLHREVAGLFDLSPAAMARGNEELVKRIEQINNDLFNAMMRLRHLDNEIYASHVKTQANLTDAISEGSSEVSDKQVIGFLRQENIRLESELEVYSDLANMGLAAEIVNHEFNQLFLNVHNAITNMRPYVKDATAQYWLNQITMGFRSISDRQNQLSPMYRTYSLRKAKTNLYDFVEEIRNFTEGDLNRNSVQLQNQVSESVEIIISKSKIFPAISNLINNAVYWVLNQKERIIRIRYDLDTRTLFVEDSGTGIIAGNKEKIFEPFVSFKPNGRGLGLTIARKVLESQGHRLEVADDHEKTLPGACFKIIFADDVVGD